MYDYFENHGFLAECDRCGSSSVENEYEEEPIEIICGTCLVEEIEG